MKMKIIILSILLIQVFTLRTNLNQSVESQRTSSNTNQVYVLDPLYYSYSPVYYSYSTVGYSYWDYWDWYYPSSSYWYVLRNEANNNNNKNKETIKNQHNMNKELSSLKKEIWGLENFSTEEIRKSNKVYDVRWLIAQLKIARALSLEDYIKSENIKSKSDVFLP